MCSFFGFDMIWFLILQNFIELYKCDIHSLWVSLGSFEAGPLSLDNLVYYLNQITPNISM